MTFSIIIPSYNQADYIEQTLANVVELKSKAAAKQIVVEILLFDSQSNDAVQGIIEKFKDSIDYVEVKKDNGQSDAINKGITRCNGDYWTWLNTDDYLDHEGFFKEVEILKSNSAIDYIYGSISYLDADDKFIQLNKAKTFSLKSLTTVSPSIFQPGSFFKTEFTKKIGLLSDYSCCFDYEYVLRCLKNNAKIYCCDFVVSQFRLHNTSKTGQLIPIFIKEQLEISKQYGRSFFSFLTWFSHLRLLKHKLFPR